MFLAALSMIYSVYHRIRLLDHIKNCGAPSHPGAPPMRLSLFYELIRKFGREVLQRCAPQHLNNFRIDTMGYWLSQISRLPASWQIRLMCVPEFKQGAVETPP